MTLLLFFLVNNVNFTHKGQSEIKTLKREREQLRREIWTLRDEYDKLENILRIKGIDPNEFMDSNQDKSENVEDENASECSECSCESCCDEDCSCENEKTDAASIDEKNNENVINTDRSEASSSKVTSSDTPNEEHASAASSKRGGKERLNVEYKFFRTTSLN